MSLAKKRNRHLAMVVAIIMAISMIPSLAFASEEENDAGSLKYIKMNVPYGDFYASYNLTDLAVWEVEPGVDAVTTATTTKFAGTTGLANGTYNDGKYIIGVSIPVAVDEETYAELSNKVDRVDALGTAANYAFADLETPPEYYSTLTVNGGEYEFSKFQKSNRSTDYLGVGDLDDADKTFLPGEVDLDDGYGDYQITIQGISNETRKIQTGADTFEDCTVYGAILNSSNGTTYGMTALENLWFGSRRPNVEIAWSVPGGQNLKRGHGKGGLFYQFEGLNGATLTGVTLITNLGVIDIAQEVKLIKYYDGDLSALTYSISNDAAVLNISGVPEELDDVTVELSNGLGSGAIEGGQVVLKRTPEDGVNYTMTIHSSNFPDITRTVATPISQAQKDELQSWIDKAKAAEGYDSNADLKEHVQEATELIANTEATSYEAAELIGELTEKVKNTYPEISGAEAELAGQKLTVTVPEGTELQNPAYALAVKQGRGYSVVSSGALQNLQADIAESITEGTEYQLTITSDNYKDVVLTVTAKEASSSQETTPSQDVTPVDIAGASITVKGQTYTGKALQPTPAVTLNGKTLSAGTDYTTKYANNTNAGKATVTITGIGNYSGTATATFAIAKAKQTLKVTAKNKTYKAKTLKKKAQSYAAIAVSANKGTVSYKVTPANAKAKKVLKFSNGKITVKKKTKKGTYKVKVVTTAKGNANYNAGSVTKTITIKVK